MFFLEQYDIIVGCPGDIPTIVGKLINLAYMAIRIGIPIILLIVGMVDLGKAVVAQKEDEIKKAQGLLIKKVIAAVLVFLLFMLIKYAINLVDKGNKNNESMWSCVNALLNYSDSSNVANAKANVTTKEDCDKLGGSWNGSICE